MKNEIENKQNFKCNIGILRIVACLMVICSHLICLVAYDSNYEQWDIANLLYIMRSACVPLFLCITGILLLQKETNLKKCIINFFKYQFLYVIFVVIYQIIKDYGNYGVVQKNFIVEAFNNPQGHLWYLPLIAQIYLFMPVLKLISKHLNVMKVYLLFWIVVENIFSLSEEILTQLGNDTVINFWNNVVSIKQSNVFLYSGYVLLGYYLYYHFKLRWNIQYVWMVYFGIISASFVYSKLYFEIFGNLCNNVWEYNSLTALIETSCLILITKDGERFEFDCKSKKIIKTVSKETLGIYLIHAFFTEKLFDFMVSRNLMLSVPICASVTFSASLLIMIFYRFIKDCFIGVKSRGGQI